MITKVWLDETEQECVECGACEACTDAVFRVENKCKVLDTDYSKYEDEIKDAADVCPADVIRYTENGTVVAPNHGPDLFAALAKANMVEEAKETEPEPIDPDKVTLAMRDLMPKPIYKKEVLLTMRTQTLTFAFAASVLHHFFPENQVLPMGFSYGSDKTSYGDLAEVSQIRARWTKPSNKMHWLSPYDISIDRHQIKYIMYIQDIKHKFVKTKRMKVDLNDLTVGELIDFVQSQFKIVQNNLSKKRRR